MSLDPQTIPVDAESTPAAVKWRGRDLVWAAVLGLMAGILVMIPIAAFLAREGADPPFALFGMVGLVIYACLFLSTWWIAIKKRGATLRDAGFRPVPALTLVKMVPVTLGMMMLTALLVTISSQLFGEVPTAQDQVVGDATSLSFGDFLWIMAVAAVAAPIAEEFLFRGMLLRLLRTRMKLVAAVAVSAIAFALLHFIPALVPALLGMGVVLAVVADRYDSLYPAMLVHALNNGIAVIAIYAALG
ncbi:MAG: CPBP family intramembrane glutamic endopeptidase [Actinomycetota bacterium]